MIYRNNNPFILACQDINFGNSIHNVREKLKSFIRKFISNILFCSNLQITFLQKCNPIGYILSRMKCAGECFALLPCILESDITLECFKFILRTLSVITGVVPVCHIFVDSTLRAILPLVYTSATRDNLNLRGILHMTITAEGIMLEIRKHFKAHIVAASYSLFIEPLKFVSFENNKLVLEIYSEWSKSIIEKRFIDDIQFVVQDLFKQKVKVIIKTS